jgi:CheY-like chemotaxis protein
MKRILIILLSLLFLASCAVEDTTVDMGKADLSHMDESGLFRLDGIWEFSEGYTWGYEKVPSLWGGKRESGSYRLNLTLPDQARQYSLYVRDCFTEYTLSINGSVIFEGDEPSIKPRIFTFSASNETIIQFDVEDRETTFGGIHSSLYFGSPEKVFQFFNSRNLVDLLIAGALLFTTVFYLCISLVDRRGEPRDYLWLAAANFLMTVRILTTYNRFLLLFIDHFFVIERISTVTTPLIAISYAFFFMSIYRYPGFGLVMRFFIGISLFYALVVINSPIKVFYQISPLYLAALVIAIYAVVHVSFLHFSKAGLRRMAYVWIIVMAILLYLFLRAFLIWKGLVFEQSHQLYGIIFLLHSVLNALRYSETYKHNISLNKQKDDLFSRVSHSFKTPLYAFKGALDLIKNSDDAGTEFEKQYKGMDRAVTDLTIQINDMLNLTEFEFSHKMVQTRVPVTMSEQTVLIVDDQTIISSILGQQLKQFVKKLNLLIARSAEEALFMLKTNNVDFIFSDIMMDGTNGYQFVSQCRSLGYLVPIYLFSAGSDPKSRNKSLEVGANGYLEKPATIEQLKKVTSLHLLHIGD